MAHLRDIDPLFPELLRAAELDNLVTVKQHKDFDLWIANYTPRAAYDRVWNVVTQASRGLIWDGDERVVARPFAKFFNWDEPTAPSIPTGSALVSQKYDGSLGILYVGDDDEDYIATRGSFHSEQAQRGTEIYRRMVQEMGGFAAEPDKTYLFEIIYPENRIVVDYSGQERLVLIDVIDNATGRSDVQAFDRAPWIDIAVKRVLPSFHHTLVEEIAEDEEGFVLYWPHSDVRVKMKGPEYVRLHKIITNCSARTIWAAVAIQDMYQQGYSAKEIGRALLLDVRAEVEPFMKDSGLAEMLDNVPDEFYTWVHATADSLRAEYSALDADIHTRFDQVLAQVDGELFDTEGRKKFALLVGRQPQFDALFRMWDDRPYSHVIWRAIRPEYTRPFWSDEE